MSDKHQKLKDYWSGVYSRGSVTYGRVGYFLQSGQRLIAHAGIEPDATILDAATGRGAVLFPAAERVGPGGQVVGVDLAEGMVRETAADARERGLENVEIRQMDTEHLDFQDATFDCVTCGFALFFFPRVDRVLAEFARVLKPGGTVAVCGPSQEEHPIHDSGSSRIFWDLLPEYGQQSPRVLEQWKRNADNAQGTEQLPWIERQARGSLSWPTRDELRETMHDVGFIDIRFVTEEVESVAEDEEEWWTWQWSHMPRATLEKMEPDLVERFKADLFKQLQPFKGPDGIPQSSYTVFAYGVRSIG